MEELRALNEHTQSSMTSEMMEVQMKIMELEDVKVRWSWSDCQSHLELMFHSHMCCNFYSGEINPNLELWKLFVISLYYFVYQF